MSHTTYNVYIAVSIGGGAQDHHAIYIDDGSEIEVAKGQVLPAGKIFQVTGSIQNGMLYEQKYGVDADVSVDGLGKGSAIGTVSKADFDSGRVEEICRAVPVPKKQFDGPKRLYPKEPLYKCQEWTRDAVQALKAAGVLQ